MSEPSCTYCGSDVETHQPVYVAERVNGCGHDGEGESGNQGDDTHGRAPVGQFCNYACLSAYIDREELIHGSACSFDPAA